MSIRQPQEGQLPGSKGPVVVHTWHCRNCGHDVPVTDDLAEDLGFKWLGPLTSITKCPNCGSYTLQRANDDSFKVGGFLVVLARNKIKGKGAL